MWTGKNAAVRVTLRRGNVLGIFSQQGQHISLQINGQTSSKWPLGITAQSGV